MRNLFANLPASLPHELTEILLQAANIRIERIVSHGHVSPPDYWYDQEEHEWFVLIQGAARLRLEDAVMELKAGDCMNIPAHQKHRVDWTPPDQQTIWLAVFYK